VRPITEGPIGGFAAATQCDQWFVRIRWKDITVMIDNLDGTLDKKRAIGSALNFNIGHEG